MITLIIGPSCSGKDTLRSVLEKRGYERVVGYTTRQARANEKNGEDYWFVLEDQFDDMKDSMLVYSKHRMSDKTVQYGAMPQAFDIKKNYAIIVTPEEATFYIKIYWYMCEVVYLNIPEDIRRERYGCRTSYNIGDLEKRMTNDAEMFSDTHIDELKKLAEYYYCEFKEFKYE